MSERLEARRQAREILGEFYNWPGTAWHYEEVQDRIANRFIDHEAEKVSLRSALRALASHPEGYCFCREPASPDHTLACQTLCRFIGETPVARETADQGDEDDDA